MDPGNYAQNNSMMIPFYNLMNEFYPSDISRKTRSSLQTKAKNGQYLAAFAPFGYKKSPSDKNTLIVDNDTSRWVQFIFEKIACGWSISKVSRALHKEKVPTPTDIRTNSLKYNWGTSSLKIIAENQTYLGSVIFGKTRNLSYKNKKSVKIPNDKWIVSENKHPALISQQLFDEVQMMLKANKRSGSTPAVHLFVGKIQCSTCNNSLNFCLEPRVENPEEGYYVCRANKRFGIAECTRHYIRYSILQRTIFHELNILYGLAINNRMLFYKMILSEKEILQQKLKHIVMEI